MLTISTRRNEGQSTIADKPVGGAGCVAELPVAKAPGSHGPLEGRGTPWPSRSSVGIPKAVRFEPAPITTEPTCGTPRLSTLPVPVTEAFSNEPPSIPLNCVSCEDKLFPLLVLWPLNTNAALPFEPGLI